MDAFKMPEERWPGIPWHVGRTVHHIVTIERAHGNELHILHIKPGKEFFKLVANFDEPFLAVIDEVHLVDRDNKVWNAQQRGNARVAAALLDHAQARIDKNDGKIGRRRSGHHVARVLDVAGRVGNNELAAGRRKIPVGNIDRNPLLSLSAKPVGEVRKVDLPATSEVGRALKGLDLVVHQRFGIVEKAADQRGLAVVHRPAGIESEEIDRMMNRYRHENYKN